MSRSSILVRIAVIVVGAFLIASVVTGMLLY